MVEEKVSAFRFRYFIRTELPERQETPAAVGTKFLKTLDVLSHIDPIFHDWHFIDCRGRSSIPLGAARPRMAALIEKNVYRDERRNPHPENGYTAVAMTGKSIDPRGFHLRMYAGEGNVMLDAGDIGVPPDPAIVTYPRFKTALLAMNAIWSPPWANACAFEVDYPKAPLIPGVPLFPYSLFHMSWISYLSAPLAAGLELPAEILTERTQDGGLLMIAAEKQLDPTNPDHLRRSRILAETMIAHSGERRS